MADTFDNSGPGKQEKVKQKLRWLWSHPEVTWSGTGIYVVSLIVAIGVAAASWFFWQKESSPPSQANTISITGDKGTTVIDDHTVVNNSSGVPPELLAKYAEETGETKQIINSFFLTLLEHKVLRDQWDSKLHEIAGQYKELLARLDSVKSEDPQVVKLKQEAKQAIEVRDYAKAEELLNQAEALDLKAIEQMEDAARQRRISAAASNVDNAKLQRIQLRYAKAAEYWQKAAALLPQDQKKERSLYLHSAAFDLDRVSRYSEALPLYEQSLAIDRELGDKAGEGVTLNNISQIYKARGDYAIALTYLEQSLAIRQEIGDKAGEGTTLSNIGALHHARGDYAIALKYLDQSLVITQEIGDRAGEGATLSNIGAFHYAKGDYDKALPLFKQSVAIFHEAGSKAEEGALLNNISQIYKAQGDYAIALKYLEQSLVISQEIGDKAGEGATLSNIGAIHHAKGDYDKALSLFEQSVVIFHEAGSKAEEGALLNNIGQIYKAQGDYATALKYLDQSLTIMQEIGGRAGEAVTSWNIGRTYEDQGDLSKAEQYMSQAVELAEEIGHPSLEKYRKVLEEVRAAIKGR